MDHVPLMSAVMTPFPYSIDLHERLTEARCRMEELQVRHLPVKDGIGLAGMLSRRELELALAAAAGLPAADELTVRAACQTNTYVVDVHERLDHVLRHMAEHHVGSVLVTKDKRLAGIFTTTDACREFATLLGRLFPGGGDSAA